MPIVCAPAPVVEPEPVVLTDEIRTAVLAEQRDHCAPSTFARFVRSLSVRQYPVDPLRPN